MDADGRNPRRLTPFSTSYHTYSGLTSLPGTSTLVCLLDDESLRSKVHIITSAGRIRKLAMSASAPLTSFGDNGIAFVGVDGIEAIALSSGTRRRLFDIEGVEEHSVDWSPRL